MPARSLTRLAGAFVLVLGLGMSAGTAQERMMERTITVSATGRVVVEPDLARITAGVLTEANTAREALDRNTQSMSKLIAGLKAAGMDEKDIQTSAFGVSPRYSNPREGQVPVVNGYQVSNQVQIVARNLSRLGETLDALVSLGANQIHGLSFEVSKAEELMDEARKEAMANALRRAQLLAAAGGADVGQVLTISEEVNGGGPRTMNYAARASRAEVVPIEAGSETLEARVTVSWQLR